MREEFGIPQATEWTKYEIDTLSRLGSLKVFKRRFSSLMTAATNSATDAKRKYSQSGLAFEAKLDSKFNYKDDCRYGVHVSAVLSIKNDSGGFSEASYGITICRHTQEVSQIVRRFHFDYEPLRHRSPKEPKPTFHCQGFGELRDTVFSEADRTRYDGIHFGLEKPRILSQPVSISLLLHWIFLEFQSQNDDLVKPILDDPHWVGLVRDAEDKFLLPYHKWCVNRLENRANRPLGGPRMPLIEELYILE